jgi:hypothetical protein
LATSRVRKKKYPMTNSPARYARQTVRS